MNKFSRKKYLKLYKLIGMELCRYIKQFKKGDMSNFNHFFEMTKKKIFLSAYMILKDKNLSDEILYDVYLKFLENLSNVDHNKNPMSYLVTISRNEAINLLNKRNKEVGLDDEHEDYIGENESFNNLELFEKVKKILPPDEFEILIYVVVEELKQKEIAKILNMPIGTVGFKYTKAIKTLRKELSNEQI